MITRIRKLLVPGLVMAFALAVGWGATQTVALDAAARHATQGLPIRGMFAMDAPENKQEGPWSWAHLQIEDDFGIPRDSTHESCEAEWRVQWGAAGSKESGMDGGYVLATVDPSLYRLTTYEDEEVGFLRLAFAASDENMQLFLSYQEHGVSLS